MRVPLIIIGGGLSGLAAAIRFARFSPGVLLLEKHSRTGGLNSYYYRKNRLFETGLHAVTNYAPATAKHAPINRLFRQLKLDRKSFAIHQQRRSEILFTGRQSLFFTNNFSDFETEISEKFPRSRDGFHRMCNEIDRYDPFAINAFISARHFVYSFLNDSLLTDMILCPLMFYGSSVENDMDLSQFIIMFRSIYKEGMFRPAGTIKDFLDLLLKHYQNLGGEIRLNSRVTKILHEQKKAIGVELENGECLFCDHMLSTIGISETLSLLGEKDTFSTAPRLGFVESIFLVENSRQLQTPKNTTIIFFNQAEIFSYKRPQDAVDFKSGVICFPSNFKDLPERKCIEIRSTHLANYQVWSELQHSRSLYKQMKKKTSAASCSLLEKLIGNFHTHIVFEDSFTPLTIKRFTSKKEGAIYGSPIKVKDGRMGYSNLFLAGTDQGFLGIIGSMLSGVSIINQHVLPKIS